MKNQISMSAALGAGLLIITLLTNLQSQAQSRTQSIDSAIAEAPMAHASGFQVNFLLRSNHSKIKVLYVNPSAERVHIELRDSKNQILYSEFNKYKSYNRSFDFTGITNNSYTLRVKGAGQDFAREITISQPVTMPIVQMHVPGSNLQIARAEKSTKKK